MPGEITEKGWLTTAHRKIIITRRGRTLAGLSYEKYRGIPWRFLFHTTEGYSIESAESAYRMHGSAPHFTIDAGEQRIHQHVSLDHGGYALRNLSGGVETNRMHCIQVEMVGFAKDTQDWPGEWLHFIGKQLLGPVLRWKPKYGTRVNPNIVETFYGQDAGWTLAWPGARQRQSYGEWTLFNGICGHQHAPENSHWDPGKLPVDVILAAAQQGGLVSEEYDKLSKQIGLLGVSVQMLHDKVDELEAKWGPEVRRDARDLQQGRNNRRLNQAIAEHLGIDIDSLGLENP